MVICKTLGFLGQGGTGITQGGVGKNVYRQGKSVGGCRQVSDRNDTKHIMRKFRV